LFFVFKKYIRFFFLAINTVNSLHGRFFSGRTVVGNYIPAQSYHKLFPAASTATTLLMTSHQ
jgi:RNA-binding protein 39